MSKKKSKKEKKYTKRYDGRKFDEMRETEMEVGIIKNATGSAKFRIGKTIAVAAVYGPKELHPRFLQDPKKAMLRCKYNMGSFSVAERKRPGPGRRDIELGVIIQTALSEVVMLENYPKQVIDVFVEIIQADAGTRCAAICAASLALADAGIPMKSLVSAIAAGKVGDKIVLDITKDEEDFGEGATDIPIAHIDVNDRISSIQLDGEIEPNDLKKAVKLAVKGCKEITKKQKKALKKKYSG